MENIRYYQYCLHLLQRTFCAQGIKVWLTPQEIHILFLLFQSQGQPVSRSELIAHVWDGMHTTQSMQNHFDVCLFRLRKKFKENFGKQLIQNEFGKGYYLCLDAENTQTPQ